MTDRLALLIESAAAAATSGGTGSDAAGYGAANLADESPVTEWRSASLAPEATRAQLDFASTRSVRGVSGVDHNLTRFGVWRAALGTAKRPPMRWSLAFDGVDDHAEPATRTIPAVADATLLIRMRLPSQPIALSTTTGVLWRIENAAGIRADAIILAGTDPDAYKLKIRVFNWSTTVVLSPAVAIYGAGQWVDLAWRYRDSDQATNVRVAGTTVASGTASAAWPNNGNERIFLGSANGAAAFVSAELAAVHYYGAYLTDAEVDGWRAEIVAGTERNLIAGYNFTTGSGSTLDDVGPGNSDMTIVGAAWVRRPDPTPVATTGVQEVAGQWAIRPALRLKAGTSVITTSVLGSAVRSVTLSGLYRKDPSMPIVDGGVVAFYGPSAADAEISLIETASGGLALRSYRGGTFTISSLAAVDDGALRRWRVTLEGRTGGLEFWLAPDGAAEVSQGTATAGAFATLANCHLGIGNAAGAPEPNCVVGSVRLWREVVLESDDDLSREPAIDPRMLAYLPLLGAVTDGVSPTRAYTTAAATWEELTQTSARPVPASSPRVVDSGSDALGRYPRTLVYLWGQTYDVDSIALELWDPSNPDGYARLGVLLPAAGFVPLHGRAWTAERRVALRPARRTIDGLVARERGYDGESLVIRLPSLRTDGDATDIADAALSEADELLTRLLRYPRERLVAVISSPWVEAHRLPLHTVVGTARVDQGISDPAYGISSTEIAVESVRRPPSS